MKVFISGSSGFVGKNLVNYLRTNTDYELLTPSHKELDLIGSPWSDTTALARLYYYLTANKIDVVIHLAARCGGILVNKENPATFIYDNLQMGINLLEASRQAKIKKFINLSTICIYPKFAPIPFNENDIWNGYPEETNAPYAIAKKAIMEMGIAYSRQHNMQFINLVPVNMIGPGDNFDLYTGHVVPMIIRKFEENADQIELFGTGESSREFLDVRDCVRAIDIALSKDVDSSPINLGTNSEIKIKDLAQLIKTIGKYTGKITFNTNYPDGQPRRCLDVSRAHNILKWNATIKLEDSIKDIIKWYKNEKGMALDKERR